MLRFGEHTRPRVWCSASRRAHERLARMKAAPLSSRRSRVANLRVASSGEPPDDYTQGRVCSPELDIRIDCNASAEGAIQPTCFARCNSDVQRRSG